MQLRVVQIVKDDRIYNQKIFESFEEAVEYKTKLIDEWLDWKIIRDCFEKHILSLS